MANAIIDYCKQKVAGVKRIIYPITKIKAVYDDNGTRLDNKLTAMQTQIDGVSTEIGTTIDEAITKRAGEDIATKEDLTVLKIQGTTLSTEEEINTFYDTYSNTYVGNTRYCAVVNHEFNHSILGGGTYYLEGNKATNKYEWQKVTSYFDNLGRNRHFIRSKVNGVWKKWRNISDGGNADTLDGKHASEFLLITGGTLTDFLRFSIDRGVYHNVVSTSDTNEFIESYNFMNGSGEYFVNISNVTQGKQVNGLWLSKAGGAFLFDSTIQGWRSLLTSGNSKPVVIDSTAPTDTTALWYNPSTKTLKSYVDGAWT